MHSDQHHDITTNTKSSKGKKKSKFRKKMKIIKMQLLPGYHSKSGLKHFTAFQWLKMCTLRCIVTYTWKC